MILALLVAVMASAASPVDRPHRTGHSSPRDAAVVVGVEDYFKLPEVRFASADAAAFRDLAIYSLGVPAERVQLLHDPSREQILGAVEEAASQVEAGGTLWVYFAGHGAAAASSGDRLLLGVDAQADPLAFESRGVKVTELADQAAGSRAALIMIVMDACFTGAGRDGAALAPDARFVVPSYAFGRPKTVLWSAAAQNQVSMSLEGAEHGAFSYAAVGALRGWADGEIGGVADGKVTLEEAHAYTERSIREYGLEGQTPVVEGGTNAAGWTLSTGNLEAQPRFSPDRLSRSQRLRATPLLAASASSLAVGVASAALALNQNGAMRDAEGDNALVRAEYERQVVFGAVAYGLLGAGALGMTLHVVFE